MGKIQNDKYYTPISVANHCWDVVLKIVGEENISEIIEPSCGDGAFYHHEDYEPHFGYDIEPDFEHNNVVKGDYLAQNIKYLEGRLIIGNPPYGERMDLARKFFKKSIGISDYIAFILPISQLNNTYSLFEFDLIYSEDLGQQVYTDRYLHCCFNIYKRPNSGVLNRRTTKTLKDIKIYRQDKKDYDKLDFDVRMCYWGDATAGKILTDGEHYAAEYKIKITNEHKKQEIIELLSSFDWANYLKNISARKIQQFHILDVISNNVSDIK